MSSPAPPASLVRARRTGLEAKQEKLLAERGRELRAAALVELERESALASAGPDAEAVVLGRRGPRMRALGRRAEQSIRRAQSEARRDAARGEYLDEYGYELSPDSAARHARRRRARWWQGRRRGFLERPATAPACGCEELILRCQALEGDTVCGAETRQRKRCDQRILCTACAMRRQQRDARTHMEAVTRLHRSLAGQRYASQLSWKLLTVTAAPGETLQLRFDALKRGVKRLRRLLVRYIAEYDNPSGRHPCPPGGLRWFKGAMLVSYEVTEGVAREGHPHAHLLVLCPYVRREWLEDALVRSGLGRIADIRAVRDTSGDRAGARELRRNGVQVDAVIHSALREVLKYCVKPLASGVYVYQRRTDGGFDRVWEARAYGPGERDATLRRLDALLYGRRTVERCGLLRAAGIYVRRVPQCPACGAVGCRRMGGLVWIETTEPAPSPAHTSQPARASPAVA